MKLQELAIKSLWVLALCGIAALGFSACKSADEHPTKSEDPSKSEHPTKEHPASEHPTSEHPTSEHPTSNAPAKP